MRNAAPLGRASRHTAVQVLLKREGSKGFGVALGLALDELLREEHRIGQSVDKVDRARAGEGDETYGFQVLKKQGRVEYVVLCEGDVAIPVGDDEEGSVPAPRNMLRRVI